jgi:hypothetical protein
MCCCFCRNAIGREFGGLAECSDMFRRASGSATGREKAKSDLPPFRGRKRRHRASQTEAKPREAMRGSRLGQGPYAQAAYATLLVKAIPGGGRLAGVFLQGRADSGFSDFLADCVFLPGLLALMALTLRLFLSDLEIRISH